MELLQLILTVSDRVTPRSEIVRMFSFVQTRGQSNLTKCASRGPIPRLGVTPGGRNLYH